MKPTAVMNDLKDVFLKALNRLGNFINKNPELEGNVQKQGPVKDKVSRVQPKKAKKPIQKDVYGHKGSGYKGKGNVNTDAAIFNHPRKDVH